MLKLCPKSRLFSVSRTLKAPPYIVWRIITDTYLWPDWGPSVKTVQCSDRFISFDSKGVIKTTAGVSIPFVINSYKEETEWAWNVGGIHATGHRIVTINVHSCILYFDMPVWAIPYAIICWFALWRIEKIAISIKNKSRFIDGQRMKKNNQEKYRETDP